MSRPQVVVVLSVASVGEAIRAADAFPALDDVEGRLLLLADLEPDVKLEKRLARAGARVVFLQGAGAIGLPALLDHVAPKAPWIAFWPRGGGFSRAAGLRRAVELLEEGPFDAMSGLVCYDGAWHCGAGAYRDFDRSGSRLVIPVELEDPDWRAEGAHALASADLPGHLLVTRRSAVPARPALTPDVLPWGLRLHLASHGDDAPGVTALFTGFQVLSERPPESLGRGSTADHEILQDQMRSRGLEELLCFGQGRLVRDDDLGRTQWQSEGLLGPEGDDIGPMGLEGFYTSPVNAAVIGPLRSAASTANEGQGEEAPAGRDGKAARGLRQLRQASVYHARLGDLAYHLLNRLSGGRFRPRVFKRFRKL